MAIDKSNPNYGYLDDNYPDLFILYLNQFNEIKVKNLKYNYQDQIKSFTLPEYCFLLSTQLSVGGGSFQNGFFDEGYTFLEFCKYNQPHYFTNRQIPLEYFRKPNEPIRLSISF